MILSMFFLCFQIRELDVPDEVVSVSDIGQSSTDFFLFDNVHRKLFRLNGYGHLIGSIGRKGEGPGAWQRVVGFRIVDREVWVFDLIGREIHIFDHDLAFLRAIETPFLVRDAVPARDGLWVVGYDSDTRRMVHLLGADGRSRASLFSGLDAEKLLGFQAGKLLLTREEMVFVHAFLPSVNIYRLRDGQKRTITVRGLPDMLVTPEMLSGKGDIRFVMRDLFFWNRTPVLRLDEPGEKYARVYPIDLERGILGDPLEIPFRSFPDRQGNLYAAQFDGDDELQKLTLIEKVPP